MKAGVLYVATILGGAVVFVAIEAIDSMADQSRLIVYMIGIPALAVMLFLGSRRHVGHLPTMRPAARRRMAWLGYTSGLSAYALGRVLYWAVSPRAGILVFIAVIMFGMIVTVAAGKRSHLDPS